MIGSHPHISGVTLQSFFKHTGHGCLDVLNTPKLYCIFSSSIKQDTKMAILSDCLSLPLRAAWPLCLCKEQPEFADVYLHEYLTL